MPMFYKRTSLFLILFITLFGFVNKLNASCTQKPNISYLGISANYPIATSIGSLIPTNTGGVPLKGGRLLISSIGNGLSYPVGITMDTFGNVYVADFMNASVKKISSNNTVTSVGSGFISPYGVAIDLIGNLYVSDPGSNVIKKIASNNVISYLGYGLSNPLGIAIDVSGNVYVADAGNNAVKKISTNNTVTILGSGFNSPSGVAVDAMGNVYVADAGNNAVKKIATNGSVTSLGYGFNQPSSVAVDSSGNIYVADYGNNSIKKIDTSNVVTSIGYGLTSPISVAINTTGSIYVAEAGSSAIKKMTFATYSISPSLPAGMYLDSITGIISGTPTHFKTTTSYSIICQNNCGSDTAIVSFGISCNPISTINRVTACGSYTWAAKQNKVYNSSNNTDTVHLTSYLGCDSMVTLNLTISNSKPIIIYSSASGNYATGVTINPIIPSNSGGVATEVNQPLITKIGVGAWLDPYSVLRGIAVDNYGNIFAAGGANEQLKKINTRGGISYFPLPNPLVGAGPEDITLDASGNIYLKDQGSVLKMAPNGSPIHLFTASGNGIARDTAGNFYTSGYSGIMKYTSTGVGSVIVSNPYSPTSTFWDVDIDNKGNVYAAETPNYLVRKYAANGSIINKYYGDFNNPNFISGIAVDTAGNIYVADRSTASVYKIDSFNTSYKIFQSTSGASVGDVEVDATGNVYVSDDNLNKVHKLIFAAYSISPALPEGMIFNQYNGIISGTPIVNSPRTNYQIIAQNACGADTTSITFSVCNPSSSIYTVTACNSFTWTAKQNTVYNASNSTDTIMRTNYLGCDSIITLNLTISTPPLISYNGVSSYYSPGVAINTLSPTNYGAAATVGTSNPTFSNLGTGLFLPSGIAVDGLGNVYVADAGNNAVKKISTNNTVTILGGGFSNPSGVAVDALGNVYVADAGNNAVKKISTSNSVSILGSGFNIPTGVAVDAIGNVYVADAGNFIVKKIATNNTVTSIGSTLPGPIDVTVDVSGNVYVSDNVTNEIYMIAPNNSISTFAVGLNFPKGITVDPFGNVYVADQGSNSIIKITPSGTMSSVGSSFNSPTGVAIDPVGNVYIAENGNIKKLAHDVYTISPALPAGLNFNSTTGDISGTPTANSANTVYSVTTQNPCGANTTTLSFSICTPTSYMYTVNACDSFIWVAKHNTVYKASNNTDTAILINHFGCDSIVTLNLTLSSAPVISYANVNTVYTIGSSISTLTPVNSGGAINIDTLNPQITTIGSGFSSPTGIAVDPSGNVYVAEYYSGVIKKISSSGISVFGTGYFHTGCVASDVSGNIYVADAGNGIIYKIATNNTVSTVASGFNYPWGLALDAAGNIYMTETYNNSVKKIAPNGAITILGSGFSGPYGIAVDASGNVYVADGGNNAIKKIDISNNVTSIGTGFNWPTGVAVDAAGNVYVADTYNNAIKKIAPNGNTFNIGTGFNNPSDVALDLDGNLLVTDYGNNMVKKLIFTNYYVEPNLPAGLSMDYNTGVISGIPTTLTPVNSYNVITQNSCGSDTAILTFAIKNPCFPISNIYSVSACDSFIWVEKHNSVYYSNNNTDTIILVNYLGCDSVVTLNLTLNRSNYATYYDTACGSYNWVINGAIYTSSGTYVYNYVNGGGCPSADTLKLVINNGTFTTQNETACGSYTWSVDGATYVSSGTYINSYVNGSGCASADTLYLIIDKIPNKPTFTNVSCQLRCDSIGKTYQWLNNGSIIIGANSKNYSVPTPGYYSVQITNDQGCANTSDTSYIDCTLGLVDVFGNLNISIIPNPCNTCEIVLEGNNNLSASSLELTDVSGKHIFTTFNKTTNGFSFNMADQSAGVYFIKNTKTGQVLKFIKE